MNNYMTVKTVFGARIDERCPGYSWFEKLLVLIGVIGDPETNGKLVRVHDEQDRREGRY